MRVVELACEQFREVVLYCSCIRVPGNPGTLLAVDAIVSELGVPPWPGLKLSVISY